MTALFSRRVGAILLALIGLSGAAMAQSPACNAWRAELDGLRGQRGGDPRAAEAARRVGGQLAQATNQFRGLGCERGFSFFGDQPPPQCSFLRRQIGDLQQQYAALSQQAQGGGGVEQRRAQLAAAIRSNCQEQPRGFFETIFGIEPRRGEVDSTMPELDPTPTEPEKPRMGGPNTVCVRSCDGYFFPLANSPGGREGADEMCQALCPGAEVTAFGMSGGGDIQNAVSRSTGQPYSSLPNALKYQRSFDATCTCKTPGQSWAQVLRQAEQLLDKRKGDVILTEQRAAELSRPRTERADPKKRGAAPAAQPAAAPDLLDEKPLPSENSPTSGTESAGVGPQSVGETVLDRGDGLRRETRSVTGEKRTVRIVAPNLAPNLGAATTRQ